MSPAISFHSTPKNQEHVSVTVIIVTFNAEEIIFDCLHSLNNQTFQDFDVILVDNYSQDGTKVVVDSFQKTANFPLKIISNKENLGFGLATNSALKESSSDFVALLNPDAKADPNWLFQLVSTMKQRPEVGICGSRVLTWDGENHDCCGEIMLSSLRFFKRGEGKINEKLSSSYLFGVSAAAAIYRCEMIQEIGFFDEEFFLQCEDTDLNFRAQLAGWKIYYKHEAKVFHRVSFSIKKKSEINIYYTLRNIEFVRLKNVPLFMFLFLSPPIFMGTLVDILYYGIKLKKMRGVIKAKRDAILMAPTMIKKRKVIMRDIKKSGTSYLLSMVSSLYSQRQLIWSKLKKNL